MPTHRTSVSCPRPGVFKRGRLAGRHLYEAAGRILMPAGRIPVRRTLCKLLVFCGTPWGKGANRSSSAQVSRAIVKQSKPATHRGAHQGLLHSAKCAVCQPRENVAPKMYRQTKNEESSKKCAATWDLLVQGVFACHEPTC